MIVIAAWRWRESGYQSASFFVHWISARLRLRLGMPTRLPDILRNFESAAVEVYRGESFRRQNLPTVPVKDATPNRQT
jgi:hypothetical protein